MDAIDADESDFGSDDESDNDGWGSDDDDHGSENDLGTESESEDGDNVESENSDDSGPDESDDNVPLAQLAGVAQVVLRNRRTQTVTWVKKQFTPPVINFTGPAVTTTCPDGRLGTPLWYFNQFFTKDMLQLIVEKTNLYSAQKLGPDKSVKTNTKELELLLGMYLRMGLIQLRSVRMYWEADIRIPLIADVMSRNRFEILQRYLHFVDNESATEDMKKNKLWKLQPFIEMFRQQCLLVIPEQHQCVDEQMISYKGKFSGIRQYIRGKPHPWGFKMWARCSSDGLLHDFEVYQGKGGDQNEK